MRIHQKHTDIEINNKKNEAWALLRPGNSPHQKRHQAATMQIKKRHLAKVNNRLSAHSARRAKKLRTSNKKLLRVHQQYANVLSKKVNKNQARSCRPQFEKTPPRVKNDKQEKFEIKSKISVKIELPGPLSVLLPPRTKQVNYRSYSKKYPRIYPYRLIQTGAHKLKQRTRHCPKPPPAKEQVDPKVDPKADTRKPERDFLTVDESGNVVRATWNGTPPTHEAYLNNQKILKQRILKDPKVNKANELLTAKDCTSFLQHFLLAVSNFYACLQPIKICFFAASNMIYLSSITNTFLQHLVYFCRTYQQSTTI